MEICVWQKLLQFNWIWFFTIFPSREWKWKNIYIPSDFLNLFLREMLNMPSYRCIFTAWIVGKTFDAQMGKKSYYSNRCWFGSYSFFIMISVPTKTNRAACTQYTTDLLHVKLTPVTGWRFEKKKILWMIHQTLFIIFFPFKSMKCTLMHCYLIYKMNLFRPIHVHM